MKKLSSILAGLCVLVGLSVQAADTNAVTSVNIVGLIKADLESNKLSFISINMNAVGGTNPMFTAILGDQLPLLSQVYFWNVTSQKWDFAEKLASAKGGWKTYTNRAIAVGEGVFVKSPSNVTINILGEVPLAPTSTVVILPQYNAYGFSYPVDTAWTSTALSVALPVLSWFNVWDSTLQTWSRNQKLALAKGGWRDGTNVILKAGQGFFVQNAAGYTNALQSRPFNP